MDTIKEFVNIGSVDVQVFKSGTDYCFHLESSSDEISPVMDVIEDTLKKF